MPSKTAIDIVFGAGSFGYKSMEPGMDLVSSPALLQELIDEFKKRGHNQIDNARNYGAGTAETIFADIKYAEQGLVMDTKVRSFFAPGLHTKSGIATSVQESLDALKTNKVHTMYLHAPDRGTPFEETLEAINEEYKKGRFEKFGLSNYTADEVEQIVKITREKGWVQPTVYEGLYNFLSRKNEDTLFPVLRKYGISFYAYSPLAGSFLLENVSKDFESPAGSRFDPKLMTGNIYRSLFFKDALFKGKAIVEEKAKAHGLTLPDVALRWLVHHSKLARQHGDAVIVGCRSVNTLKKTLDSVEQPPLPADVVKAIEDAWAVSKDDAPAYHF